MRDKAQSRGILKAGRRGEFRVDVARVGKHDVRSPQGLEFLEQRLCQVQFPPGTRRGGAFGVGGRLHRDIFKKAFQNLHKNHPFTVFHFSIRPRRRGRKGENKKRQRRFPGPKKI